MEGNTTHHSTLKIGFLTPEFPHKESTKSAGLGSSIKNLAMGLVSKGISVYIFIYGQSKNAVIEENGLQLYFIKTERKPFLNWYFQRKQLQKILNNHIQKEGIQLIETQDWTGIAAFLKLKAKLIIRIHGSDAYFCNLENRTQKKKNFWLEKKGLQNADHIVAVSAFSAKKTKEVFQLNTPIQVIYNGIDTTLFQPNTIQSLPNTILYFGTIIRKKGVLALAKAFNILIEKKPEVQLIMLGKDVVDVFEGVSTIKLFNQLLSQKSKQAVSFISEVPYKEVKRYLAEASIITLPSFAEAFPMTWLEAMAMEKPMVTSNIGWANEMMIDHKTGYTVAPNDSEAYAEKLYDLLINTEKAENFGKAARNHVVANFALPITVEKNIEYYKTLLK